MMLGMIRTVMNSVVTLIGRGRQRAFAGDGDDQHRRGLRHPPATAS